MINHCLSRVAADSEYVLIAERFFSGVLHAHLLGVRSQDIFICIERSPSGMGGASATAWLAFKGGAGGQGMRPRSLVVRQRKFVGMA